MLWVCHEERRIVNAEGCDEFTNDGKRTMIISRSRWLDYIDTHLKENSTSHRKTLLERNVCKEARLEYIDFSLYRQEFRRQFPNSYMENGEQVGRNLAI